MFHSVGGRVKQSSEMNFHEMNLNEIGNKQDVGLDFDLNKSERNLLNCNSKKSWRIVVCRKQLNGISTLKLKCIIKHAVFEFHSILILIPKT